MAFIHVPTSFVVYEILNTESGVMKWVTECKTKGEAVEWIYRSGSNEAIYCIQEHLRKS